MEKQNKKIQENFHVDDLIKKINLYLGSEKSADILIIKSHLICEYYMNQLLILREICSAKKLERWNFYEKIKKTLNLNNEAEKLTFNYVNQLTKLRNKVGHKLEYTLSESDVDSLGYIQGKDYILNKYEIETDIERLRNILTTIIINVALLLINTVISEKGETKSLPKISKKDKNN